MTIESAPGTYALILSCSAHFTIELGRLGAMDLHPGFYVYVGSALGPGGLAARVAHHMRIATQPHWHIDYLRSRTRLEEVWYTSDRVHREHEWADLARRARSASIPLARFGASDCRCDSHLFYFEAPPSRSSFQRRLRKSGMAPLRCWSTE